MRTRGAPGRAQPAAPLRARLHRRSPANARSPPPSTPTGATVYELFRLPGTPQSWIDAHAHVDRHGPHRRTRSPPATASSSRCRTSATGTSPARGWPGQGYTVTVVAEPLEPPELFEWFVATRDQLGMRGDRARSPTAGADVLRALARQRGRVPALRPRPHRRRCRGRVLRRAHHAAGGAGHARPAQRRAAPRGGLLLPAPRPSRDPHPRPDRHRAEGRIRDDVTRVTQELAHRFEDLIREQPEHWHLLQPNWPSDR